MSTSRLRALGGEGMSHRSSWYRHREDKYLSRCMVAKPVPLAPSSAGFSPRHNLISSSGSRWKPCAAILRGAQRPMREGGAFGAGGSHGLSRDQGDSVTQALLWQAV